MKKKKNISGQGGFSLLEIFLVMALLGVVSAFAIGIISSLQGISKTKDTRQRMEIVAQKAKDYYRGHGNLPLASASPAQSVPTDSANLDLEQKFRLDAWGRYFQYYPNTPTSIVSFTIDGGKPVGGVIISGGPNQAIDVTSTTTSGVTDFVTINIDDIVIPINVSAEATEIALTELKELQARVSAFDKLYAGVDNDNNAATVDTSGVAATVAVVACPPTTTTNDPNSGLLTMDEIDKGVVATYGCPDANVLDFIIRWYGMADAYKQDPWGNDYDWGDATSYTGNAREHKFFSAGPDGVSGNTDDIIP
ncbi:prepilin-type N-terminal cleavage/methylation domain-containing protein [Desulfobacula phenolica]|uniref:Prepilin-type N-terminal cleavage/methylation domain-containing protein n=1 Tax=Desulfobacula phenolica TaxID=90732 RepID=A0A1H2IYZ3_9BACT|nr:prepilin-type N-terminal cleavage/methylation domain-containing protein [Desulfobacula phenolica]SDU49373.1 prepilin-type N-terminal cleavage/methylation domain-containing protein [Desulfobacula phenolica]